MATTDIDALIEKPRIADDGKGNWLYYNENGQWMPITIPPDLATSPTVSEQIARESARLALRSAKSPGKPFSSELRPAEPAATPEAPPELSFPGRAREAILTYLGEKAATGGKATRMAATAAGVPLTLLPEDWTSAAIMAAMLPTGGPISGAAAQGISSQALSALTKMAPTLFRATGRVAPAVKQLIEEGLKLGTGKVAAPTIAGGVTGEVTGEGAARGAGEGAIAGLLGKGLERLTKKAVASRTGVSSEPLTVKLSPELYQGFDMAWGPEIGKAINLSIPSLEQAGVTVHSARDIMELLQTKGETVAQRRVGKLFDNLEKRITDEIGTIDMPVKTTETVTRGTARTAREATAETATTGSAIRSGKTISKPTSDVQVTREVLQKPGRGEEGPTVTRIQREPFVGTPAETETISGARREAVSERMSKGEATTARTGRSSRVTEEGVEMRPLPIKTARDRLEELEEAARRPSADAFTLRLAREAKQAFDQAIDKTSVAPAYRQLREDYAALKALQEVFSSTASRKAAFPLVADKARVYGLNPVEFASSIMHNVDLLPGLGGNKFWRLFNILQGMGPKTLEPIGGYFHQRYLPSFRLTLGPEGAGVEMIPEFTEALAKQKHTVFGPKDLAAYLSRQLGGHAVRRRFEPEREE